MAGNGSNDPEKGSNSKGSNSRGGAAGQIPEAEEGSSTQGALSLLALMNGVKTGAQPSTPNDKSRTLNTLGARAHLVRSPSS